MDGSGGGSPGGETGLLQQILSLSLVPRVGNATVCPSSTTLCSFPEMWYGVFLWALVSSLFFHIPAGLLALFTLRHHKYGRFMSVGILLMGILGPISAGILTNLVIFIYFPACVSAVTKMMLQSDSIMFWMVWGI
ncbi:transmembrane protein 170A isoform X2 [Hyla sarda]|uniref:transmembrane protein 170A isoform X2 n=1 Tax=Hyla sarda TaxID=327740 RepID=UPI0024C44E6F|nr:transmembrane protein 170A isoform X2 [Hyla sarda]